MADSSPRFRHDLIATAVEVDGVRCVDVRDPDRDVSFRFYDFEYDLALQLDGRPASEISAWAIATYGMDLTAGGIAEFAARLSELGFLITEADGDLPPAGTRKSDRATLAGFPPPANPIPARREDDSQPLSQVVSRAVQEVASPPPAGPYPAPSVAVATSVTASATPLAASALPAAPTMMASASSSRTLVASGGAETGRRSTAEVPLLGEDRGPPRTTPAGGSPRSTPVAGGRASATAMAAVPRWMAELDSTAIRPGTSRELVPVPAPAAGSTVGETMMGFAAVAEQELSPGRESGAEPSETMGTVMGFAAVTEAQIRDAEKALARISPPPQGTSERRMPPRPESVVMSPFQAEEVRRRPPEAGLRRPAGRGADRSTAVVIMVVAVAVIAAAAGYYVWSQHQAGLEARRVRIIAPRPAAVYRWFDVAGSAVVGGTAALGFSAGGSVADVLPPGSHYGAGEIIAKLEGAASREADVNRARSRVAYHQQIRDSMRAANNIPEMRKAEIKIVEKQAQLDEAEAALDRLVIRASESGEVAEVIARRGSMVEANAPAVRVRTGTLRGEFTLAPKDADAAAHLGFCRVEIVGVASASVATAAAKGASAAAEAGTTAAAPEGAPGAPAPTEAASRFSDCRLVPPPGQPGQPVVTDRFEVDLPASAGVLLGQPLRLARVRYDGVFPVPRSAVVRVGGSDRLFVVGPGDTAQARAITIADSDVDEVVVSQGIDVGDRVIVDPPGDLRDGSPLTILR